MVAESKDITKDDGVIVVKGLVKRFNSLVVLDGVNLACQAGQTTTIIGPSGCGKTVLMKHMIALERPTEGEVYYQGQRIDQMSERKLSNIRTTFGFLFQSGALFDSMNVFENVTFPIRQHFNSVPKKELEEVVKHKLAMVGMDGFQSYYPANLSGGQQKRVALARAITLNPKVILYDEPTTGLDPIRSDVINELILKLQKELGVTSIVVTHDMKSAYKISDRIVMLYNGRIIADGDADRIKNHPHPQVQYFINGSVSEADLEALRLGGTKYETQFLPEDFVQ